MSKLISAAIALLVTVAVVVTTPPKPTNPATFRMPSDHVPRRLRVFILASVNRGISIPGFLKK